MGVSSTMLSKTCLINGFSKQYLQVYFLFLYKAMRNVYILNYFSRNPLCSINSLNISLNLAGIERSILLSSRPVIYSTFTLLLTRGLMEVMCSQ